MVPSLLNELCTTSLIVGGSSSLVLAADVFRLASWLVSVRAFSVLLNSCHFPLWIFLFSDSFQLRVLSVC